MKKYFLIFFLLVFSYSHAQLDKKKSINALRITKQPTIDGVLDEDVWFNAAIAKDFVMFRPGTRDKEPENKRPSLHVVSATHCTRKEHQSQ